MYSMQPTEKTRGDEAVRSAPQGTKGRRRNRCKIVFETNYNKVAFFLASFIILMSVLQILNELAFASKGLLKFRCAAHKQAYFKSRLTFSEQTPCKPKSQIYENANDEVSKL